MENRTNLEDKVKVLLAEMDKLRVLANQGLRRGKQHRPTWLTDVERREVEVDELVKVVNELKQKPIITGGWDKFVCEKKVDEILKSVKALVEAGKDQLRSARDVLNEIESDKLKQYSYLDLIRFTSDFSTLIGQGGYGKVYKGHIPEGIQVAVKVLFDYGVGEDTFVAELRTMGKTSHRNLATLRGFCYEGDNKALVYEYMENGSLDMILYQNPYSVEWAKLYGIAIGAGMGISYLHEGCNKQIIHHDIKPANILLDSNFFPKVTDFGMAKLLNLDMSRVLITRMPGTPGYIAPEIIFPSDVSVTCKCDVYSYGMMLFEILGRRRNSTKFPRQVWQNFENEQLDEFIGRECGIKESDSEKARTLAMVALWCIQNTPDERPSMSTVVKMLQQELLVKSPPRPFSDSHLPVTPIVIPNSRSSNEVERFTFEDLPPVTPIVIPNSRSSNEVERFTFEDLCRFTSDFSIKIGGAGTYGAVYKGQFPNSTLIAVKILINSDVPEHKFVSEVRKMSRLEHPNLVKIYGFCFDGNTKALVLEFFEKGSMDQVHYGGLPDVTLNTLYDILLGTAKGVSHLHENGIICGLKDTNMLLDSNLSPKVTDFGLARLLNMDTPPPGYFTRAITDKYDVYMLGQNLVGAVYFVGERREGLPLLPEGMITTEIHKRRLKLFKKFIKAGREQALDWAIGDGDREKARLLINVAAWCLVDAPGERPPMINVAKVLAGDSPMSSPPGIAVSMYPYFKRLLPERSPWKIASVFAIDLLGFSIFKIFQG